MNLRAICHTSLLSMTLVVTSCSHSTFSEKRPAYHSTSASGQIITQALKHPFKEPRANIGKYLDAVAAAGAVFEKTPNNAQARADYNFAVGRIFEIMNDAGLQPWKAPLACPGATKTWAFALKPLADRALNPSNFKIRPADRYQFKGRLVANDGAQEGLGAPLVVDTKDFDFTKHDQFAQGKHAYYGMTGVVEIKGNNGIASLVDALSNETVTLSGRSYPLAADFTAPTALALAEFSPGKKERGGLIKPGEMANGPRLALLQPYDPKKIPLLCIHGLGDSEAIWAPMIESLRTDPVIRKNYQIWFFSYPSGYPYPLSASILRQQLDAVHARYPDHKKIVVIGHSMGGMISRVLMTDSGMKLWNATYDKSPGEMDFVPETRKSITKALIFQHRPEISRVIFLSPSHCGANLAKGFMGKLGSFLIPKPKNLFNDDPSVLALAKANSIGEKSKKMPTSVDFLNPENRFVKNLAKLPLAKGIPYHSIIGDRGKGGNPDHTKPASSDGIVEYWSSHLDGAQSEIIIPSGHWTNKDPLGIAEVRRILYLHLGKKYSPAAR